MILSIYQYIKLQKRVMVIEYLIEECKSIIKVFLFFDLILWYSNVALTSKLFCVLALLVINLQLN